ncbi:MAG: response regulator transcription factor [Planctomycetaceae bacterium]|nr:response regulator transcription factor [Planctomycetaceae bacterium]
MIFPAEASLEVQRPLAILVTGDLFLGSRLKAFAENAGYRVMTVAGCDRAIALSSEHPDRIVLDLTAPRMNVESVVDGYAGFVPDRIAAYAPHVRTDLLRAARAAGLRSVFTRSQLDIELPRWLAQ